PGLASIKLSGRESVQRLRQDRRRPKVAISCADQLLRSPGTAGDQLRRLAEGAHPAKLGRKATAARHAPRAWQGRSRKSRRRAERWTGQRDRQGHGCIAGRQGHNLEQAVRERLHLHVAGHGCVSKFIDIGYWTSPQYRESIYSAPMTSDTDAPVLKAVLFADLAEYSRLTAAGEDAAVDIVTRCFGLFRDCCGEHRGEFVKSTGDGVLVI